MKKLLEKLLSRKVLLYLGYAAFFFASFLLFAYWTFPYDRVRDFIVQEVERPKGPDGNRRPSGLQLEIVSLSPSWITGVELEGVRLVKQPDEPDGKAIEITLEEVTARIGVLAALSGGVDVSYDVTVGGGTIEGQYEQGEESTYIEMEVAEVQLRQLGIMSSLVGLPVAGIMNGQVEMTIADDNSQTDGTIDLAIDGLQIGGGQVPIPGMSSGLTVERIRAGKLEIEMSVEDGVARVTKLASDGDDLTIEGSGTIRLMRPLEMSRLDLMLKVAFSEAYRNQSDHTRRLFSAMDFVPDLRAARTPDGALQWRISGSPGSRVSTTPAGRAR